MKSILRIARTEFYLLFCSPIAWLLLSIFTLQTATGYMSLLKSNVMLQHMGGENLNFLVFLTSKMFTGDYGLFIRMMENLYLYIPLVTMGLMSREISSGTIRLLYSSPVRGREIVLGKYLAVAGFALLLVMIAGIFAISGIFQISHADTGLLFASLAGMFLLLCAYAAIGLFFSSLTGYQIVAAIAGFIAIGALNYIGNVGQRYSFIRDITYYLSLRGRTASFMGGLFSSVDVCYFLVIIYLFIGLTICRMKATRESSSWRVKFLRYAAVIVSGILAGYISSLPVVRMYYDASAGKWQTLSPAAQTIVRELDGAPLEVTTYVNVLASGFNNMVPENRNRLLSAWDRYLRFKPDMRFHFVLYYDTPLQMEERGSSLDKIFPGKTMREAAVQVATGSKLKMADIKTPEEIHQLIDLRPEQNRQVMLLKWKNNVTYLRFFDDLVWWPGETEVAAAFKRLLKNKLPRIYFLNSNLERSIVTTGERSYRTFTSAVGFRWSMVNQGFDTDTLSLDTQELPTDAVALVLADPRTALSDTAMQKLRRYIAAGGNMLICGEPGKQDVLNPLLATLGVQFREGEVAQPTAELSPDLAQAVITPFAGKAFSYLPAEILEDSMKVIMPGVTGMYFDKNSPFHINPLLVTDAAHSWQRKNRMVTDSAAILFDSTAGDLRVPVPVMAALTRQVNGKEQRIIVAADADFMSNFNLRRYDVKGANFPFTTAMFSWLDYGAFPVNTSRPAPEDTRLNTGVDSLPWWRMLYVWLMPGAIGITGIIFLLRRKRQ